MTEIEQHAIIRRWLDARVTGTVHGAECSCGEKITGPSPASRDEQVRYHLDTHPLPACTCREAVPACPWHAKEAAEYARRRTEDNLADQRDYAEEVGQR